MASIILMSLLIVMPICIAISEYVFQIFYLIINNYKWGEREEERERWGEREGKSERHITELEGERVEGTKT